MRLICTIYCLVDKGGIASAWKYNIPTSVSSELVSVKLTGGAISEYIYTTDCEDSRLLLVVWAVVVVVVVEVVICRRGCCTAVVVLAESI